MTSLELGLWIVWHASILGLILFGNLFIDSERVGWLLGAMASALVFIGGPFFLPPLWPSFDCIFPVGVICLAFGMAFLTGKFCVFLKGKLSYR